MQAGGRGEALVGVYCASKAAVISLTQSAGLDLIRHEIAGLAVFLASGDANYVVAQTYGIHGGNWMG